MLDWPEQLITNSVSGVTRNPLSALGRQGLMSPGPRMTATSLERVHLKGGYAAIAGIRRTRANGYYRPQPHTQHRRPNQ
jgi:hypothetical protein